MLSQGAVLGKNRRAPPASTENICRKGAKDAKEKPYDSSPQRRGDAEKTRLIADAFLSASAPLR